MTRQRQAQVISVLVLAGALGVAAYRKGTFTLPQVSMQAKTPPSPQDAIYAMIDAASAGNVSAYAEAHSGQMAESILKSIAESGETAFSEYLKKSNADVKGVAVMEPQTLTDREVKVRVEYVYQDRNEVQQMYLDKVSDRWKINRVDSVERIKTLVPYGTPVR